MNRDELRLAVAEIVKKTDNKGNPALAELITTMIEPNHITFDVFSRFMNVETFNPGDYFRRRIRKGRYRARTQVNGASHLTDATIYNDQFQYAWESLIVGTSMNLIELRSGELGTVESITRELKADLVDQAVAKIFNLLTTVWNATNTPLNYVNATSTGLTQTVLETAIENLLEKAGNIQAIVGTRRALLNLYNFAGYRDVLLLDGSTREALRMEPVLLERFRTGRISTYNGIPVIEIPQILDNRLPIINQKLVRDDVVLLIGAQAGTIAQFNEFETQEYTDMSKQPADWSIHIWKKWGILLERPEWVTVIETA